MQYPIIALLSAVLLSGCAITPTSIVQYPTTTRAPMPEPVVVSNGSIYQPSTYRPAFEDRRARHVGDVLTLVITERTSANKAGTATGNKSGSVSATLPGKLSSTFGNPLSAATTNTYTDGDNQTASEHRHR